MENDVISSAKFEKQKEFVLPKGGTLIRKTETISVREISNGFILAKSFDIKWRGPDSDDTQYEYYTKEWYSKDNPVTIKIPKEKSLAEKLD